MTFFDREFYIREFYNHDMITCLKRFQQAFVMPMILRDKKGDRPTLFENSRVYLPQKNKGGLDHDEITNDNGYKTNVNVCVRYRKLILIKRIITNLPNLCDHHKKNLKT